ncbi:MAG: hypothetical protein BWY59_01296 [Verrucomicrobia bacterium ADurb.Bin345]|nr:MAG: hypothetical protein BWY59_01296 [Verrucomicrobia bacterium ADurb.Bin345]
MRTHAYCRAAVRAFLMAILFSAADLGAQEPMPGYGPPRPPRADAPAVSALRRFVVSGMASADNIALSVSADDASQRLEAVLGVSVPFSRYELIRIVTEDDAASPRARVIKGQAWVDRQLVQRLIVFNPGKADQEDLLEGLCWLMLNRLVIARQDISQRTNHLGAVPDWLGIGIAQNLYPALRARNGGVISRRWMAGETVSFPEVLEMEYLPDGRWGEKAAAGLAVGWLLSQPQAAKAFECLFSLLAKGEPLAMPAIVECLGGDFTPVRIEKEWELWIAQQTQVIRQWGGVTPARVQELQAMSVIRPMDLGFPATENIPAELTLDQLVERRRELWMRPLAALLSLRVRGLGIGESEEFRRVLEAYGRFFDALGRSVSPGLLRRLFRRVPSQAQLLDQLAQARKLQEEFLTRAAQTERRDEAAASGPDSEIERFMPRAERLRLADELRRGRGR